MSEILRVNPIAPEPSVIAHAAELLRQGEVVAIPTDTIYGLAANPFDVAAVEKVFAIKGRPKANPLLLLIDSVEMAAQLSSRLPDEFDLLAKTFWPGPLTIVVPASPQLPPDVTANTGTIGLRLPSTPIATALIRAAGCPITATSANRSGEPDSFTAQQVEASLADRIALILDGGASRVEKPSTVVKLSGTKWEVVRAGAIPTGELEAVLNNP